MKINLLIHNRNEKINVDRKMSKPMFSYIYGRIIESSIDIF